jgi:hypothetical protein
MPDPADRLYGLPLEEFTAARDAAARELRRAGDRDAAGELSKLPKPTPAAWAANQLARSQPELIHALLDAGEALREAQADAVGGGGGEELREATAAERRAVDAVVKAASALKPAGRPLSRAMADRLRATLHAAAADEGIRAALASGRLASEAEAGGAWPLAASAAPAAPRRRRETSTPPARGPKRTARRAGDREADVERRAAAREAAEREAAERRALEAELRAARTELRKREHAVDSAERAADRAQKWLVDAQRDAEAAERAVEDARGALDAARDDVARLEERLD